MGNNGTGRSYASEFFLPNILNDIFDKGYPLVNAYKDMEGAAKLSAKHKIPLPVMHAALSTYQLSLAIGFGAEDKGALGKVFENILDVKFRKPESEE